MTVPIRLLNRSTEIWGEDANEFRYSVVLFSFLPYRFEGGSVVGPSDGRMCRKLRKRFRASMATC